MRTSEFAIPAACLALGLLAGLRTGPGAAAPAGSVRPAVAPTGAAPDRPEVPPAADATAPAVAEGRGTIEGRVATEDGVPVEGVVVVAFRYPHHVGEWPYMEPRRLDATGPPPIDAELTAAIDRQTRRHRARVETRREAVTGRDGHFAIAGLPDEFHQLLAYLPGWRVEPKEDRPGARPGEAPVLFVARPLVRLPVEVVGPDGKAPRFATIRIRSRRYDSAPWTPARPEIELTPGEWRLTALDEGEDLHSGTVRVKIAAGEAPDPVRLELRSPEATGLGGTVTSPRGTETAFDRVVALELPDGADADPARLVEEGVGERLDHGKYRFADLAPGRYLVGVVRHLEVLTSEVVTYGGGLQTLDFVVPGAERPAKARLVRVLRPDGEPDPYARVSLVRRDSRGGSSTPGRPEKIAPGEFLVFPPPAESGTEDSIRVFSERYGYLRRPFDPGAEGEVEIRFEEPAFLTVRLSPYAGSPYEYEVRLSVLPPGQPPAGFAAGPPPPGPDGRQRFGPLAPGRYEVVVTDATQMTPIHRQAIDLASGEQTVAVALPPAYTLTIRVDSEEAARHFYLVPVDKEARYFRSTPFENGAIRYERLPPGRYVLSRHAGPREHMPLVIEGDTTIDFEPIPFDARRVVIEDPDGPLARTGLATGDVIVAIDGTEITGEEQGYGLQRAAQAKGHGVFTVLRGGRRIDVDVDLPDLDDRAKAGGRIESWYR